MQTCPWCEGLDIEEPELNTNDLCRGHLAEHEGLSESELDRMDADEAFEASGR